MNLFKMVANPAEAKIPVEGGHFEKAHCINYILPDINIFKACELVNYIIRFKAREILPDCISLIKAC